MFEGMAMLCLETLSECLFYKRESVCDRRNWLRRWNWGTLSTEASVTVLLNVIYAKSFPTARCPPRLIDGDIPAGFGEIYCGRGNFRTRRGDICVRYLADDGKCGPGNIAEQA
jgi:hypothetical protein